MQLKKANNILPVLASATCALLSTPNVGLGADTEKWDVDSALLLYSESDNRVQAVEPVVNIKRLLSGERVLNIKLVSDSLTGASPSGATPSNVPQTFTRPSGNGSYITPAGETPIDDTFKDTRTALAVVWQQPLDDLTRGTIGVNVSDEYDFQSFGISSIVARDFNKRNTTLTAGLSTEFDTIQPQGGIPIPLASMTPVGASLPRMGSDDARTLTDLLLGVTQVINRQMIMQLNYTIGNSSGYHTDPFKLVSVVDPISGSTVDLIFESRPEDRRKQSLYWATKYHLKKDIIDLSYRYMWDDWGIGSHTFDTRYRWYLHGGKYLEPHLRYYRQSEADFYHHSLVNGTGVPEFVSADYRLAELTGTTIGAEFGLPIYDTRHLSFRVELYQQRGETRPSDAIGEQQSQDLFPDFDAIIAQVSYSFKF